MTEQWVDDHNQWLIRCAEYRQLRHKLGRLATIRREQKLRAAHAEYRKLLRKFPAKKQPATVRSPATQGESQPGPKWESLGETLCGLLANVPESVRLDVAAYCVILRDRYPHVADNRILARARRLERDDRTKNRFVDYETCERKRSRRHAEESAIDGNATSAWRETEYHRDNADYVAEMTAKASNPIDSAILTGISLSMTQAEIGELIGHTASYVCKRINAMREEMTPLRRCELHVSNRRRRELATAPTLRHE